MADRRSPLNDRNPAALAAAPARDAAARPATVRSERLAGKVDASAPRPASKFSPAADGWDAYNTWLDRVRQPAPPPSRQAVIAKALYSVSSYKSWADQARGAFEGPTAPGNAKSGKTTAK